MSVYDLYQSYLDQMQQSPVMQSPVMENPLYNLLLLQQQQGGGDGGSNMASYSDPNVGPGFQDYEAQAYGIGNTVRGSIAGMIDAFSQLPTPMNLAMRGIKAIGNVFGGRGPALGPAFTATPNQMAALMSEMSGGGGGIGGGIGGDPNASMGDTGMATGGDGGGVGSSSDAGAGSTASCGSFKYGGFVGNSAMVKR